MRRKWVRGLARRECDARGVAVQRETPARGEGCYASGVFKVAQLPRTLPAALRDVESPKPGVRSSAIKDLARFAQTDDRAQVLSALVRALDDDLADVRADALVALADAHAAEHVARIVDAASDAHPRVRQMALLALGEVGSAADGEARGAVARALDDEAPALRFQALISLHRLTGGAALGEVLRHLGDADAQVRYICLRIAEEHWLEPSRTEGPDPELLARLAEALADPSEKVRLAAAIFLARTGDGAGADQLVAAVEGRTAADEPEDEQAAIDLVGDLKLEAAHAGLSRRAWGWLGLVPDRFAFQARIALAKLGDRRAIETILRDLSAWNRDARTLAVVAAGRARLAEAKPLLESMRGKAGRAEPEAVEAALQELQKD